MGFPSSLPPPLIFFLRWFAGVAVGGIARLATRASALWSTALRQALGGDKRAFVRASERASGERNGASERRRENERGGREGAAGAMMAFPPTLSFFSFDLLLLLVLSLSLSLSLNLLRCGHSESSTAAPPCTPPPNKKKQKKACQLTFLPPFLPLSPSLFSQLLKNTQKLPQTRLLTPPTPRRRPPRPRAPPREARLRPRPRTMSTSASSSATAASP